MALSGSTDYNGALGASIKEEWIFELRNNTYTDGSVNTQYIRLGTALVGSGATQYHSLITNIPSVRESIDLQKSTATVGNISISCVNGTLSNHSNTLAEEIYGGSRNYINRDVIVSSRVGGYTEVIFQGRLKEVKLTNQDIVSIVIAVHDPIQNISVPQEQSKSGNFFPIFYGTGSPETSTVSFPQFVTDARVFPVQVDTLNNDVYNCLIHESVSDGRLHYPVRDQFDSTDFPMFVPMDAANNTSTDTYEGETNSDKNVITTDLDLERSYLIRPQTVSNPSSVTGLTISNAGNAYDTSGTSTSATFAFSSDDDISSGGTYVMTDLPKEEHEISELKFHFIHQTTGFSDTNGSLTITLRVLATWNGSQSFTQVQYTANQSQTTTTFDLLDTGVFSSSLKAVPDEVRLFVSFNNSPADPGNGTNNTATTSVKDMYFEFTTKIEQPTTSDGVAEKLSKSSAVNNIKKLYIGSDGLDKSFSSGEVTLIHDMHRDLLYRFAGVTDTPDGYTDLNTDRANWFCKYYTHKQVELKKLLEQTQKEGGFIFRFRPSNQTPQYIHIRNSSTTKHTIKKSDITNLNISITPFESLVTKREVKHEVNPINDKTFKTTTCTDTTNNPRTTYNINTKENVKTDELMILRNKIGDTNMGGSRNNGFANYYNAIEGNPKLLITTEIINPGDSSANRDGSDSYFYLMEVGDICAFDHTNMIVEPFGESFNGKQFIVTSLTRSPGSLKVSLREI